MDQVSGPWNKSEWRARMRAVRDSLTPGDREERSRRLCGQTSLHVLNPMRAKLGRPLNVCVYAAFRSEADPAQLILDCLTTGDQLMAPRILPDGEGMELRKVESLSSWVSGRWGVPEPDPDNTSEWDLSIRPDVVLVPGLAFNEQGGRLGYGGGYYDRLYAKLRESGGTLTTRWIGFAYELQVIAEPLPMEPHDLRLSALATETGLRRFAGESE
ncbi:5-formyltetrahydrofolate cyclo-ligase [Cohnella panacarvi]|uniref:5-formyltetrahydrofolate cyclo-ligase n=1 Tax=Cohnella panacarvi TaxID=400776 RepID=UPI0004793A64|nr:5-formyltetrahydrofolate cyclo-ligase [Cohnella panacarvi]